MIQKIFKQNFLIEDFKRVLYMNLQSEIGKSVVITEDMKFIIHNFIKMICNEKYNSIDPETKKVKENDTPKGFYVAGGIGSGKTTFVKCLLKTCKDLNIIYNIPNEETNFHLSLNIMNTNELGFYYANRGDLPFVQYACFCYDDLLKDSIDFSYMGNKMNVDMFLQTRYIYKHTFTFVTSNYPMSEKFLKLDKRTISRLFEMCAYYELKNEDFRTK